MSLRILWFSNAPWAQTGYGQQTQQAWWRIQKLGHKIVAIAANYGHEGMPLDIVDHDEQTQVWPRGFSQHGNDIIAAHAKSSKCDIVISLYDTWIFDPRVTAGFKWCLPENAEVSLIDGTTKTIKEIVEKRLPLILEAYDKGKMTGAKIEAYQVIPAKAAGEIIEITTLDGHRLEVTAENEIAVRDITGEIKWVPASCVNPGMVIYCSTSISSIGVKHEQAEPGTRCSNTILAQLNKHGMGIPSWNDRCGRECVDSKGDEAKSVYPTTANQYLHDQRESNDMVALEVGDASEWKGQADRTVASWGDPITEVLHRVQPAKLGVQGVSDSAVDNAIYDSEETASGNPVPVLRKADDAERDQLQQPICGRGSGALASSESFEPQFVRSVRSLGRPYETVYDIKTSTGNFVANGILVHNCPWLPVDHDPLPINCKQALQSAWQPICYAQYGMQKLQEAGFDPVYVPHGIETSIFKPGDKAEARNKLGLTDYEYIAVMVAANKGAPSRKAFREVFQAWSMFVKEHPNSMLYLHSHTGTEMQGEDLEGHAQLAGIPQQNLRFADQYRLLMGYPQQFLATVYQAANALVSPSYGEGFGLPIIEAQACGCPVIVNDCTSMSELCFGGWKTTNTPYSTPLMAYQFRPDIQSIYECLEASYKAMNGDAIKRKAINGARNYDADLVCEKYWKPALEKIEADLKPIAPAKGVMFEDNAR